MDIGIFIEYDNRVVQFPVNPEKFAVKTSGSNETTEIIALGEIVIPRKKKLSGIVSSRSRSGTPRFALRGLSSLQNFIWTLSIR